MSTGTIFDIKEMTVHDGPGVRVTVFLKGCPLRCKWCHNPEGLSAKPELMRIANGCTACGKCKMPCHHPPCREYEVCMRICPRGLIRLMGEQMSSAELVARLQKYAPVFEKIGGGVTFSGGEPLMQPQFLVELLEQLDTIDTAVETSGYAPTDVFLEVAKRADLILFDLKIIDPEQHRAYTGVDNRLILQNLTILKNAKKPFIVRLPMIPGVNDNEDHFTKVASLIMDVKDRVVVEVLPFNPLAGAKYPSVGRTYQFLGDKLNDSVGYPIYLLADAGISCRVV